MASSGVADPVTPWLACEPRYDGPFHTNIVTFLSDYGTPEEYHDLSGVSLWVTKLHCANGMEVDLHIYEERVTESGRVHCDNCRCIGEFGSMHHRFWWYVARSIVFN